MKKYALIGHPLGHSFSQRYFTEKFKSENIQDSKYENFEIENIKGVEALIADKELCGFNITKPYKQEIMPYLKDIDSTAREIGAVNCVKVTEDGLYGYNTDVAGFEKSLLMLIGDKRPNALVLGTGGASKAVCWVLKRVGIEFTVVSRRESDTTISYEMLTKEVMQNNTLIINSTPLGTYPDVEFAPDIPYELITSSHYLYDLVYNPADTAFIRSGRRAGAWVMSGYMMLKLQAERGWEIFGV